ncbi:gas vesicle protein GvpO [Nocardiopsis alkaliphila]|uniref:gas vesicle protein GvpO n=1 Tax=Nocardiopsis alkaliphila TaxID=225762 RepID=UPI000345E8FB|nr:gas vesicle protein [Nocardiopsis alkaliphila]
MTREKPADGAEPRSRTSKRPSHTDLLRKTRQQLEELIGIEIESVSGMEQTEDGWSLTLEALELRRVPDTMSLLATYVADTDRNGSLTSYHRVNRYARGRPDRL